VVRCVPPHVRQSQNLSPLRGQLQKGQTTMRFFVQQIDETGAVVNDDVSGFPMSHDGAHTVLRMMAEKNPQNMYILVPLTGGVE